MPVVFDAADPPLSPLLLPVLLPLPLLPLPLSEPEFEAVELLLRPLFMALEPVPGGLAVWLVPAVPLFIDRLELVPVPVDADPDAPAHPGRFIDAEPEELSEPDELLFSVEDPGDAVDPLIPEEVPDDPLAAAPPDAPPLAPPEPPLCAKAAPTLKASAMPVRGYNNCLLTCMNAHSVCCPLPNSKTNVPEVHLLHAKCAKCAKCVCRKTVAV